MRKSVKGWILSVSIIFPVASGAIGLSEAKEECSELGFKGGTQRHGECVLQLYSKNRSDGIDAEEAQARLQQSRRELEAEAAKAEAARDRQQAAAEIERLRRQKAGRAMMSFGLGLMAPPNNQRQKDVPERCSTQPNGIGGYILNCE